MDSSILYFPIGRRMDILQLLLGKYRSVHNVLFIICTTIAGTIVTDDNENYLLSAEFISLDYIIRTDDDKYKKLAEVWVGFTFFRDIFVFPGFGFIL